MSDVVQSIQRFCFTGRRSSHKSWKKLKCSRTGTSCASSQEVYIASSAGKRLMTRCKSALQSVWATCSKLSCICFKIPYNCKRVEDERSGCSASESESVWSESCSPHTHERFANSVASGWRTPPEASREVKRIRKHRPDRGVTIRVTKPT